MQIVSATSPSTPHLIQSPNGMDRKCAPEPKPTTAATAREKPKSARLMVYPAGVAAGGGRQPACGGAGRHAKC